MGDALLGVGWSTMAALNFKALTQLKPEAVAARPPRRSCQLASSLGARCNFDHPEESSAEGEMKVGVSTRRVAVVQLGSGLLALHELVGRSVAPAAGLQQNTVAGRIPGLSEPDSGGLRTYRRPDGKSGGHGVGWSPIIPYSFKVPTDWEEIPVSIADLGGTEIDLRFQSLSEGNISVVVAPVLRFSSDLGDNVKIEDVGVPEKVIDAFGPELTGETVEGKVKSMDVMKYGGRTYYQYELAVPHMLISATAAGNRLYLFSASGNGRQWKKFASNLKDIRDSFRVG